MFRIGVSNNAHESFYVFHWSLQQYLIMPRVLSTHPDAVCSRERRAGDSEPFARSRLLNSPSTVSSILFNREHQWITRIECGGVHLSGDFSTLPTYSPSRITTPWRPNPCPYCSCLLLQHETSSWCCNNGARLLPLLPPLPMRLQYFSTDHAVVLNINSRRLNYLFCLSAIGASEHFNEYHGIVLSSLSSHNIC